jgi:hypothetical protein
MLFKKHPLPWKLEGNTYTKLVDANDKEIDLDTENIASYFENLPQKIQEQLGLFDRDGIFVIRHTPTNKLMTGIWKYPSFVENVERARQFSYGAAKRIIALIRNRTESQLRYGHKEFAEEYPNWRNQLEIKQIELKVKL